MSGAAARTIMGRNNKQIKGKGKGKVLCEKANTKRIDYIERRNIL